MKNKYLSMFFKYRKDWYTILKYEISFNKRKSKIADITFYLDLLSKYDSFLSIRITKNHVFLFITIISKDLEKLRFRQKNVAALIEQISTSTFNQKAEYIIKKISNENVVECPQPSQFVRGLKKENLVFTYFIFENLFISDQLQTTIKSIFSLDCTFIFSYSEKYHMSSISIENKYLGNNRNENLIKILSNNIAISGAFRSKVVSTKTDFWFHYFLGLQNINHVISNFRGILNSVTEFAFKKKLENILQFRR